MKTQPIFSDGVISILFSIAITTAMTNAADTYFVERLQDLDITDGELPAQIGQRTSHRGYRHRWEAMQSYATLDGEGRTFAEVAEERGTS